MNWDAAIMIQRTALLRMLAALRVLAGVVPGGSAVRLPKGLYLSILRVLRPAESAARRLVVVSGIEEPLPPLAQRRAAVTRGTAQRSAPRAVGFAIVDRPWHLGSSTPRTVPGAGPRMTIIGWDDPVFPEEVHSTPDDSVDALPLSLRLQKLEDVLNDLPRYAKRLARWRAKQARGPAYRRARRPLRPGRPPGHRKRPTHEVDAVLTECHILALRAFLALDSS